MSYPADCKEYPAINQWDRPSFSILSAKQPHIDLPSRPRIGAAREPGADYWGPFTETPNIVYRIGIPVRLFGEMKDRKTAFLPRNGYLCIRVIN